MPDRAATIAAFLAATGHADWQAEPLAADASRRRYVRLRQDGRTAMLMDAPPATGERVGPFLRIARHLLSIGICAPDILNADPEAGLVLMEDLGPSQAARHLDRHPGDEAEIYVTTAEMLADLQAHPAPDGLGRLDPETAARMIHPVFEAGPGATALDRAALEGALTEALRRHARPPRVLSLRDLHAENIIWRPHLTGRDRLGLLDFQDAVLAPPAYDLASLLDDVRRDVAETTGAAVLATFADRTGDDPEALAAERAVLSVQRNLRILGVFGTLIHRDGKTRYAAFLPRLRGLLRRRLSHPACADIAPLVHPLLSPETERT